MIFKTDKQIRKKKSENLSFNFFFKAVALLAALNCEWIFLLLVWGYETKNNEQQEEKTSLSLFFFFSSFFFILLSFLFDLFFLCLSASSSFSIFLLIVFAFSFWFSSFLFLFLILFFSTSHRFFFHLGYVIDMCLISTALILEVVLHEVDDLEAREIAELVLLLFRMLRLGLLFFSVCLFVRFCLFSFFFLFSCCLFCMK